MTGVKICGITCLEDALEAVAAGADALGFVFCESPRRVSPATARNIIAKLPGSVLTVGVFLDAAAADIEGVALASGIRAAQLHGNESVEVCNLLAGSTRCALHVIKRFTVSSDDDTSSLETRMAPYSVSARLLDPGAGSGQTFRWEIARGLPARLIVAGGLDPENVARAIRSARPYGVDVCSGVERAPGRKCPERLRAFVGAAKAVQPERED